MVGDGGVNGWLTSWDLSQLCQKENKRKIRRAGVGFLLVFPQGTAGMVSGGGGRWVRHGEGMRCFKGAGVGMELPPVQ